MFETLIPLAGFSLVSSITPGPNNLMLLASGVNFGFTRSFFHMIGISAGFAFLLACVGLGVGQILENAPFLFLLLKIAGATYLIYLAYKIAVSGPINTGESSGRPMRFIEAAAFQWVNPKAWVMAISSMTIYTNPENYLPTVMVVVAVFTAVNLPCIATWCGLGTALRQFLSDPKRLKLFNYFMALLLVLSLWPMLD